MKKTIEPLEDAGLNPLVYKDDLANIFDGEANLLKAIDIIEKWRHKRHKSKQEVAWQFDYPEQESE